MAKHGMERNAGVKQRGVWPRSGKAQRRMDSNGNEKKRLAVAKISVEGQGNGKDRFGIVLTC